MMIGLHLPNKPWDDADWPRIRALQVREYVDLAEYAPRWAGILAEQPDARIHARIDRRGRFDVAADADALTRLARAHPEVCTYRVRNEPNIESPGETWQDWGAYLVVLGDVLPPDVLAKTSIPAVSPGKSGWLNWWYASADAAAEAGFQIMDCHAYGSYAEVAHVLGILRERWAGRLLVTETNFGAGRSYNLELYAAGMGKVVEVARQYRAECLCWFIWTWRDPDMVLPTSVNVKDSPMEAAIAALVREGPVTGEEFDRWAADVWHRAGVPFNKGAGITRFWLDSAKRGHYLGKPEGPEHRTENGEWAYAEFSGAVLHCRVGEWIVSEGLPPFA